MLMLNPKRLKKLIHRNSLAALALAASVAPASVQAHHPDREHRRVTPTVDLIGPMWTQVEPGHRRKYNRPTYWGGKISYLIAPSSQEAMAWHRAVHAKAYEEPKKCLRLEQHYFYPKPYHALTVGPRRPRTTTGSQSTTSAQSPASDVHHHPHQESLASPLSSPLSTALSAPLSAPLSTALSAPLSAPLSANDLHAPMGDDSIALPEISPSDRSGAAERAAEESADRVRETQELSAPSNSIPVPQVDDSSRFLPRGNIRRAVGKPTDFEVSRDAESSEPKNLDVAERPVFLRRILNR